MEGRRAITRVEYTMSTDPIILKRDGDIATITLNNPAKRNALSLAGWHWLSETIESLDKDESLRCIIIQGAGDKAFAAGADISEFPEKRANAEQAYVYGLATDKALEQLLACRHPVIAMIRGACTGGGLEIAACCDMRIASETARFGVPIKRIGHAFAPSEMKPLLDLVGKALVLEFLMEGQVIDATEALRHRLVNRVVDDAKLETEVKETAARIASGAPLAARMTKKVLNRLMNDPAPISEAETRESYTPCDSDDYREGFEAFIAKRPPKFKGS